MNEWESILIRIFQVLFFLVLVHKHIIKMFEPIFVDNSEEPSIDLLLIWLEDLFNPNPHHKPPKLKLWMSRVIDVQAFVQFVEQI